MTKTSEKSKVSVLKLVYPPISNQEAVWLQDDPEVAEILKSSDFYMIVGRTEAKFTDVHVDEDENAITLAMNVGTDLYDTVKIDIQRLPGIASANIESFWIEAGDKNLRLWDGPIKKEGSSVLEWFTTEKLLFDRWRGRSGICGLDRQGILCKRRFPRVEQHSQVCRTRRSSSEHNQQDR